MGKSLCVLAAGALALAASAASAQHAQYVFIGERNPEADQQTAEMKFVHPITSPYFHEDSFVTSDVRLWYLYHDFPSKVVDGNAQVGALQLRLAITKDIQLVAYKDGYTNFSDDSAINDHGWNDIAAGVKWNFLHNFKDNLHASVGVGYEFPWGESKVLQNDEEVRIWGSVNKGFGPIHLGATANVFFAPENRDDGDYMSWHLHADYYLCRFISPVLEVNGYHFFDDASQGAGVSGIDVTNLGSGDDVVTLGMGAEIRPLKEYDLGIRAAFETPLTDETDLYGWRVTLSAVYSF